MDRRPPFFVRLALAIVRLARPLVPKRDREGWRREWEAELQHGSRHQRPGDWGTQVALVGRALGSIADATWLRRQFTRESELLRDARHATRLVVRQPSFFTLAVLVMGLGIGSTTAVFSVADGMLLRRLPYPDAHQLVAVWQRYSTAPGVLRGEVTPGNFLEWRAGTSTYADLASAEPYAMDYTGGERPEVFFAANVSERFFDLLGVTPVHGRLFAPEDHVDGRQQVALIGERLWKRRFAADPSIVGRTIPLDGMPYTVVGILPASLELNLLPAPGDRDLWLPKVFEEYEKNLRGPGWWAVIGRLKAGVTLAQAQADLDVVSARLAREYPRTNGTMRAALEPLGEHLVGEARPALTLLLWAVAVVLLIACANVANMMLARASDRDREFAVRAALGASRARLARQLLAESLLVSLAGSVVGLLLAVWLVGLVVSLAPRELPRLAELAVDWRLAAAAVVVGLGAGLVAGLIPAAQLSRPRPPDALGAGRSATASRGTRRVRDGLAVAEIALAVALVVGAGLLLRSFARLVSVDPGFRADRVLALQVFAWDRQDTPEKRAAFFADTIRDLSALPGVTDVGAVSAMPFIEANINIQGRFVIEGRPPKPANEQDIANLTVATPGYFPVMGIPLVRGRHLAATDTMDRPLAAVISSTMAERYWPGANPLGSWIQGRFDGRDVRAEVVGIVGEIRHDGLDRPTRAEIFFAQAQVGFGSMTYVVRTANDPSAVAEAARQVIWRHDPLLTFYDTASVSQLVSESVAPRRFSLVLVTVFAVTALVLAAAGIYGVLSVGAARQRREFGVRIAMGATAGEIGRLVVARGLRLGATGLALGLAAAALAGGWLRSLLFEVSPLDPVTLGGVSVLVLAVAVAACYVPARRAMRVDPITALRTD
jgi:putative ABC transport system permease protein